MAPLKRKRTTGADREPSPTSSVFSEVPVSDGDVDISSTLMARKWPQVDDDDDEDFIRETMAKHNVKSGTEIVKKTKGKSKITKGEVGGGSFQSMGGYSPYTSCYILFSSAIPRSSSGAAKVPHPARVPRTNSHPTPDDT